MITDVQDGMQIR